MFRGCYTVYKDGNRVPLDRNQECLTATDYPFWKMIKDINVKIETDTKSSEPSNEKSLTDITGIDKDLAMKMAADKVCQTEKIEIIEEGFFEEETNHYLLLELIASDLELSDIII